MKVSLQEQRFDVWKEDVTWYIASNKPMNTVAKKEFKRNNKISMDFILDELPDSVKVKVVQCSSTKEIWGKLHNVYFEEYPLIIKPKLVDKYKEYA